MANFDRVVDRRRALHGAIGVGAVLVWPAARACEFHTSTLRVTHPWTRATAPGDRFAVLGMKIDEVVADDRLVMVRTPVAARADIAGEGARPDVDLPIHVGQELNFDESSTYVRLLDLALPLELGRTYPLVLGFEKGGRLLVSLSVDYERLG